MNSWLKSFLPLQKHLYYRFSTIYKCCYISITAWSDRLVTILVSGAVPQRRWGGGVLHIYMKRYTIIHMYAYIHIHICINIHIMHMFAAWLHCSLDIGDPCPWLHFWQLPRLAPGFWLSWKRAYYGNIIISHIDHTQYMKLSVTQSCTERTWLLTRWLYLISKCTIQF